MRCSHSFAAHLEAEIQMCHGDQAKPLFWVVFGRCFPAERSFKLQPSLVRGGCYSYVIMLALLYSLAHSKATCQLERLCDLPSPGAQQVAWYGYCGFANCASS
uniref:Uncharacterized protein n=1 Tax=Aegilops tauschii subsp. strangulata TaxID=200361 RepID=A0A453ID67_AEGTS